MEASSFLLVCRLALSTGQAASEERSEWLGSEGAEPFLTTAASELDDGAATICSRRSNVPWLPAV